jgi:hypothetical protein
MSGSIRPKLQVEITNVGLPFSSTTRRVVISHNEELWKLPVGEIPVRTQLLNDGVNRFSGSKGSAGEVGAEVAFSVNGYK